MIPKLNWNRKNIGKLILLHEFNQIFKPKKKIKNNQFNIKWFFNRFLFSYYQRNSLTFIENRLDLILFRTNWFKSYNHLNHAILTGNTLLNGKIVKNGKILLKKGDIIRISDGATLWKKPADGIRKHYMDWFKNKYNFLLQNPIYLEINNNIKTIILLSNPEYKNIPYPVNLNRMIQAPHA